MAEHFFPEPCIRDDTWASRGEPTIKWLERSTLPRAANIRTFLNYNLNALPAEYPPQFYHNLRVRWHSALFELVVARLIELLGGEFCLEVQNTEGRRPDFNASFDSRRYIIEAIAPQFDQMTKVEEGRNIELLNIIERNAPPGWSVLLSTLPEFGPGESKAPLKALLRQLADLPPPEDEGDWREISIDLPQGTFECTLVPRRHGDVPTAGGPMYTSLSDSESRVRHALRKKKRQTRSEKDPVILAVLASGISSSFEDFDKVLFGHSVSHLGPDFRETHVTFEPNGVFARKPLSSSYAAVLAFINLTPFGVTGPILYVHPQLELVPSALTAIEQRMLSANRIMRRPAGNPELLGGLRFASLD
jgi:hypothetical protein